MRSASVSTLAWIVGGMLAVLPVAGCEKGPAQEAGEKVDRAVDELKGKGPVEKAGERLDKAVDELKK